MVALSETLLIEKPTLRDGLSALDDMGQRVTDGLGGVFSWAKQGFGSSLTKGLSLAIGFFNATPHIRPFFNTHLNSFFLDKGEITMAMVMPSARNSLTFTIAAICGTLGTHLARKGFEIIAGKTEVENGTNAIAEIDRRGDNLAQQAFPERFLKYVGGPLVNGLFAGLGAFASEAGIGLYKGLSISPELWPAIFADVTDNAKILFALSLGLKLGKDALGLLGRGVVNTIMDKVTA